MESAGDFLILNNFKTSIQTSYTLAPQSERERSGSQFSGDAFVEMPYRTPSARSQHKGERNKDIPSIWWVIKKSRSSGIVAICIRKQTLISNGLPGYLNMGDVMMFEFHQPARIYDCTINFRLVRVRFVRDIHMTATQSRTKNHHRLMLNSRRSDQRNDSLIILPRPATRDRENPILHAVNCA